IRFVPFRIEFTQSGVRLGAIQLGIDVAGTSREKNAVDSFRVSLQDFFAGDHRYQQRNAPGPKHSVQVLPKLPDIFGLLMVTRWNADPRFVHAWFPRITR